MHEIQKNRTSSADSPIDKFDMNELLNCMHCGFCLPACPTFQLTGYETYSPRGRIGLMKGVAEGKLPVDEEFEKNMYACLGCRACETACPAGVKYGHLIETAREVVEDTKKGRNQQGLTRKLVLHYLFMHPKRLRLAGKVLWAMQAVGLQKLATRTGLHKVLGKEMAEMQDAVEIVASPSQRKQRRTVIAPEGRNHSPVGGSLRVGLFTGCVMDILFYETNEKMARLLSRAGCEVVFVQDQACCGALHAHSGEKSDAVALAKRNIDAVERAEIDYLVNNAGGCGAALREYDHWLCEDAEWNARAQQFVAKVRDITELLAELPPLELTKLVKARVTYQDSCHLFHGQGVCNQPRDLLRRIPGVEYVELPHADSCCGSAGIYNITNFEMSMQILDGKMQHVRDTRPDIVVTANPGCLLQMKKGIIRAGLEHRVEAVHIVDLIDRAL